MVVSLFITLLVKAVCRFIYLTPTAEKKYKKLKKMQLLNLSDRQRKSHPSDGGWLVPCGSPY
jgi:hypothetical protein